jgi:hypothetical protein
LFANKPLYVGHNLRSEQPELERYEERMLAHLSSRPNAVTLRSAIRTLIARGLIEVDSGWARVYIPILRLCIEDHDPGSP